MAYTKPQQRKKEESERLRGERDQIKFIDILSRLILSLIPILETLVKINMGVVLKWYFAGVA